MRAVPLVLVLVATALTGCLGGGDDGADEELRRQRADVTAELGGIEGVVTDTAVQPVVGANVTLVETDTTVRTADDGSYAFSRVQPGTYTLAVRAPGFVSASETVRVNAGQVSNVDLLLAHLASEDAYTQALELVGFFECGVEVGWNLSALPQVPPANPFFLGWAACATPNSVLQMLGGGNATNDRFSHFYELDPPVDTVVYEMTWQASSQFSEWMTTSMNVQGIDANDGIGRFMRLQGPSPIQERLNRTTWETLDDEFRTACEDGSDAYCGYSFWDQGWPLQSRVFPAWQCQSEEGGVCAVLQQEFTHVLSVFYNAPAPEGYSALG